MQQLYKLKCTKITNDKNLVPIQIKHKETKSFTGVQLDPTVLPCGLHGQ